MRYHPENRNPGCCIQYNVVVLELAVYPITAAPTTREGQDGPSLLLVHEQQTRVHIPSLRCVCVLSAISLNV